MCPGEVMVWQLYISQVQHHSIMKLSPTKSFRTHSVMSQTTQLGVPCPILRTVGFVARHPVALIASLFPIA